jgi:hypothetical protein
VLYYWANMSNQLKEEPKKTPETFLESFRPTLYKSIWGGIFTMIISGILALLGFIYFSADWAKYMLGGAAASFVFGVVWITLVYFYRRDLIKEGVLEPKHSFFVELIYGTPDFLEIQKELDISTKNLQLEEIEKPKELVTKTERAQKILDPSQPPEPTEFKVTISRTNDIGEIKIRDEHFKVISLRIEKPTTDNPMVLSLNLVPSARDSFGLNQPYPVPPFPSYTGNAPEWLRQPIPKSPAGIIYRPVVMQSLVNKEKIIFCVPYSPSGKDPKAISVWCSVVLRNEDGEGENLYPLEPVWKLDFEAFEHQN